MRVDRLDRLDGQPASRAVDNASSCLLIVDFGNKPGKGGIPCTSRSPRPSLLGLPIKSLSAPLSLLG